MYEMYVYGCMLFLLPFHSLPYPASVFFILYHKLLEYIRLLYDYNMMLLYDYLIVLYCCIIVYDYNMIIIMKVNVVARVQHNPCLENQRYLFLPETHDQLLFLNQGVQGCIH